MARAFTSPPPSSSARISTPLPVAARAATNRLDESAAKVPVSEPQKVPAYVAPKGSGLTEGQTFRRKCPLPALKDIAWEKSSKGGWECWHCPNKTKERSEKTYLGYVGKKLQVKWDALPADQRRAVAVAWIAERRAGKGLAHADG